tara:strand:- start:10199 stop:10861 length:663 start_codon:yes stop_codon:yes gene_type:complete
MIKLKNYDSFFFDCDGVILNSNKIKTEAFRETLKNFSSEKVDEFINYHLINGGVSRYEKIEYFFKRIDPKENPEKLISESLNIFSDIVKNKLLECDLIDGIEEFLDSLLSHSTKCFVMTGGDEDEVKFVFNKRSLSPYFTEIMGSPKTKYENMDRIIQNHGDIGAALFFGDSKIDYEVSRKYGCEFVFISEKSEWVEGDSFIKVIGGNSAKNFHELINKS